MSGTFDLGYILHHSTSSSCSISVSFTSDYAHIILFLGTSESEHNLRSWKPWTSVVLQNAACCHCQPWVCVHLKKWSSFVRCAYPSYLAQGMARKMGTLGHHWSNLPLVIIVIVGYYRLSLAIICRWHRGRSMGIKWWFALTTIDIPCHHIMGGIPRFCFFSPLPPSPVKKPPCLWLGLVLWSPSGLESISRINIKTYIVIPKKDRRVKSESNIYIVISDFSIFFRGCYRCR